MTGRNGLMICSSPAVVKNSRSRRLDPAGTVFGCLPHPLAPLLHKKGDAYEAYMSPNVPSAISTVAGPFRQGLQEDDLKMLKYQSCEMT